MWVIPGAGVVLTDGCSALGVGDLAGNGRIFQYLQQYVGICLFLQLTFLIWGVVVSFLGRTKERSTSRKKETLLLQASSELQSSSGTSVSFSLAIVSITAIAPSGKYRETSYKPIF